jgi:hypothetical protein
MGAEAALAHAQKQHARDAHKEKHDEQRLLAVI